MSYNFDDIRPYTIEEYYDVVNKLLSNKEFVYLLKYFFKSLSFEDIKHQLLSVNTIDEFQQNFIIKVAKDILNQSVDQLTYNGIDNIEKDKAYVLISNHRDIVLDSALINFALKEQGYQTSQIAIGDNLLKTPWVSDLVRLNKNFIVKRGLPNYEMLEASKKLSAYIQHTLIEKKESIWIAQREGRAKDGNDYTNPGLLKMLCLGQNDLLNHIKQLNILPISVSYQYNPCDALMLNELIAKHKGEDYVKADNEDNEHMKIGVLEYKGCVHICFGESINEKLLNLEKIKNKNDFFKTVASIIDQQIHTNYKLWNTNYMAYDLLNSTSKYEQKYTKQEFKEFIDYINQKISGLKEKALSRKLLLEMYANPVINAQKK